MAAPVLPLIPKNLCSLANVGVVGAWMLFPDDETWRVKYIKRFATLDALKTIEHSSAPSGSVVIGKDQLIGLFYGALEAATRDDVEAQFTKRSDKALLVGRKFWKVTKDVHLDLAGPAPMKEANDEIKAVLRGDRAKYATNSTRAQEISRIYWPVSALWAAFYQLNRDHLFQGACEVSDFPCAPHKLPEFLSLSERLREKAEGAKHKSGRVIEPGICVRLPDEVLAMLPHGTLTIAL